MSVRVYHLLNNVHILFWVPTLSNNWIKNNVSALKRTTWPTWAGRFRCVTGRDVHLNHSPTCDIWELSERIVCLQYWSFREHFSDSDSIRDCPRHGRGSIFLHPTQPASSVHGPNQPPHSHHLYVFMYVICTMTEPESGTYYLHAVNSLLLVLHCVNFSLLWKITNFCGIKGADYWGT